MKVIFIKVTLVLLPIENILLFFSASMITELVGPFPRIVILLLIVNPLLLVPE